MGLYLCAFAEEDEIEGIDVGSYSEYGRFVETIVAILENAERGSKYPLITLHSDCDGEWSAKDLDTLQANLVEIREAFRKLPAFAIEERWQKQIAKTHGLKQDNLSDCFFDVDGEPLIDRLLDLIQKAKASEVAVLFQ